MQIGILAYLPTQRKDKNINPYFLKNPSFTFSIDNFFFIFFCIHYWHIISLLYTHTHLTH